MARTGWSKQGGFEIYLDDWSLGEALWDALWAAGGDLDVGAGCPNVIERIEGGLLSYGGDMTRANNPFECGFDAFVQLDRPIEIVSRRALEHIAESGPERRIMGLRIAADSIPGCTQRWPVFAEGEEVGAVTSAAMSPDLAVGVAIAMMERSHWEDGTPVTVETPDGTLSATVSSLPFTAPS